MEGLWKIWAWFTPPDPPLTDFYPELDIQRAESHMKAYRTWSLKVSWTLAVFTIGIVVACFTPWGFVQATDFQDKIDSAVKLAIAQEVKDIKTQQKVISDDVSEIKGQNIQMALGLKELLRSQTSTNICRLLSRWAVENDRAERGRLRVDADTEQDKYKAITGDFYPESRCGSRL